MKTTSFLQNLISNYMVVDSEIFFNSNQILNVVGLTVLENTFFRMHSHNHIGDYSFLASFP